MNKSVLATTLLAALLLAPGPVHACGEGLFNMGQGLRYQGYLAPRPAAVLVYDLDRAPAENRIAAWSGPGTGSPSPTTRMNWRRPCASSATTW